MQIENRLKKDVNSEGAECYYNSFACHCGPFDSVGIEVEGKKNSEEYYTNLKMAEFFMEHLDEFINKVIDFAFRQGYFTKKTKVTSQIIIFFDSFNMIEKGSPVDCYAGIEENKGFMGKKSVLHRFYIKFDRDENGQLIIDKPDMMFMHFAE